VDDPQFANWTQRVSQIYDSAGFALQARDVLEQSLAKAGGLSESSPVRIALLDAIARSWAQDRNLLKAVTYLEQAVAATEAQPKQPAQASPPSPSPWFSVTAGASATRPVAKRVIALFGRYPGSNDEDLYRRLFDLYHQLGRPQDATAVLARIAAHVKNSDGLLASLYQQQGQIDEAAAIYKRQAAQAADPQQAANALQSLANMLRQAGEIPAADEAYGQLMAVQTKQQVGMVIGYANYLEQTNRVDQAEKLLNDYQASHAIAEPLDEGNLMNALADVERISGNGQLAEEYQRRASALWARPAPRVAASRVADDMQRAMEAVNAGKLDEALNLTLRTLDSAAGPSDLERAYPVASLLESRQAPAKADEIYRRAVALAESWSAATVEPLLRAQQNYTGSLRNQLRWSEFEQALGRDSATLTAARGAGTGWLEDSLRLRAGLLNVERRQDALDASQQLAKLEESLSGNTSEPYLRATETLVKAMEANEDLAGALPLRRTVVAIADLVFSASNETRPATLRIDAAMAYARMGRFDEAEALAKEAIAIGEHMHPAAPGFAEGALWQILQMRQAAQPSAPKQ